MKKFIFGTFMLGVLFFTTECNAFDPPPKPEPKNVCDWICTKSQIEGTTPEYAYDMQPNIKPFASKCKYDLNGGVHDWVLLSCHEPLPTLPTF